MTMAVCLLLAVVGIGVYFFVYGGTIYSSMEKLLEEGDYTRREKSRKSITGPVSVIYWLVATAIFYDLYLWPQRQRPAPIQLDHLGGGRCAVCRGAGGNKADKEPEITALERKHPKGRFFAVLTGTACGKMKKACCNFAV